MAVTGDAGSAVVDLDLRLVPEFDGVSQDVAEWIDKLELVCRLKGVHSQENVIPLRLTGGAFSVYQQLDDACKSDAKKIKEALLTAFAADKFSAYEQFVARRLRPSESVDVYLADLRRLSRLAGGVNDAVLACAFVAGLPEAVRHSLRAGSRMESLELSQIVARARALMADSPAVVAAAQQRSTTAGSGGGGARREEPVLCYNCRRPGHLARQCRAGRSRGACFACGQFGHFAAQCPGNGRGEEISAPVSSPARVSADPCRSGAYQ